MRDAGGLTERELKDREKGRRQHVGVGHQQSSVADFDSRLNLQAERLACDLLGEPNRKLSSGNDLRFGAKGSLSVVVTGTKAGRWYDHEKGLGGDALKLISRRKNISAREAIEWAREWLDGDSGSSRQGAGDPVAYSTASNLRTGSTTSAEGAEGATHSANDEEEPAANKKKVDDILASCVGIEGTPAGGYLCSRGITATPPDCIRFRPNAYDQRACSTLRCVFKLRESIFMPEPGLPSPSADLLSLGILSPWVVMSLSFLGC